MSPSNQKPLKPKKTLKVLAKLASKNASHQSASVPLVVELTPGGEETPEPGPSVTAGGRPTPTTAAPKGRKSSRGRPVDAVIWKYFSYNEAEDCAKCLNCDKVVPGLRAGNAKSHLQHHHGDQFFLYQNDLQKKESEKDSATKSKQLRQSTLLQVSVKHPYPVGSVRYENIVRAIATTVAMTNMSLNVVEHPQFRNLIRILDPRSPTPGRTAVRTATASLYLELKKVMSAKIALARRISMSADGWCKKGMAEAFMGVTAHFVDPTTRATNHMTLACRSFPPPHKAADVYRIVDAVAEEWKISTRVSAVVTDNGSNMVAAFKDYDDEAYLLTSEEVDAVVSSSDGPDDAQDSTLDNDVAEFTVFENDCDVLFVKYKRRSCFIHRLQIAVKSFDSDAALKPVLTRARKIISSFRHSVMCTVELTSLAGKTLIADVSTRWNSTLLAIRRILEVKDHVAVIMAKHLKIPALTPGEWKVLELVVLLLSKFELVTTKMSGEKEATIHKCVTYVKVLRSHLEIIQCTLKEVDFGEYGMENPFEDVVLRMANELERVFAPFVDPRSKQFDGIYLATAMLHGYMRHSLTDDEENTACAWLLKQHTKWNSKQAGYADVFVEPPVKKSRIEAVPDDLDLFVDLREIKAKRASSSGQTKSAFELELQRYREDQSISDSVEITDDPRAFWSARDGAFPELSQLALDLLAIPASSASVERLFSVAGVATQGRSARLAGLNLERKVMIQRNWQYLLKPLIDNG